MTDIKTTKPVLPAAVQERMKQGIPQHKAIAMQGQPKGNAKG